MTRQKRAFGSGVSCFRVLFGYCVACTHPGCKARLKNRRTMYTHRRNQHGGADGGKYVVRCDTCHAEVQRKNLAAHKMFFNPGESI